MTEQHTECAALNCTVRSEHLRTCNNNTCTGCWPRPADHGHLCQKHYDRVDTALQIADRLKAALAAVERAVRSESSASTVAGPRVPLTAWQLDLDRITRAAADKTIEDRTTGQQIIVRAGYHGDIDAWISTFQGALDALDFAFFVHSAEINHPLEDRSTELRFVRCGGCLQRSVILRPPNWYTGHRTLKCSECGWSTTDDDHASASAYVEAQVRDPYPRPKIPVPDGPIDLQQMRALARALQ